MLIRRSVKPAAVPWPVIGAVLLTFLPALARSDESESEWVARYRVRFGSPFGGVPQAHVDATLRWIGKLDDKPSWLDVGMAEDGFPKGYGALVRSFAASVPRETSHLRAPSPPETLYGDDISFLVDEPLTSVNAIRWRPFLCHEVFHLWNGHALEIRGNSIG